MGEKMRRTATTPEGERMFTEARYENYVTAARLALRLLK
jgi:hypothetical protein